MSQLIACQKSVGILGQKVMLYLEGQQTQPFFKKLCQNLSVFFLNFSRRLNNDNVVELKAETLLERSMVSTDISVEEYILTYMFLEPEAQKEISNTLKELITNIEELKASEEVASQKLLVTQLMLAYDEIDLLRKSIHHFITIE